MTETAHRPHRGRRRCPTCSQERDRGVVLAIVALSLVTLITMTAMTIDLGRLMIKRRDLQALSDVVALDMIRDVNGRTRAAIEADSNWNAALIASVQRNPSTAGTSATPVAIGTGSVKAGTLTVTATLGTIDATTRAFTASASGDTPTAVQIKSSDSMSYFFAQVIGVRSGSTSRTAAAGTSSHACFSVGSYAAAITASGSALGGFLSGILTGNSNTISLVSYQGLAAANVSLLDLLGAQGNVGTVDGLLASQFTAEQFRVLAAQALRNQGDIAHATILEGLSFAAAGSSKTTLGSLLNITTGDTSAATAQFNVLNLIAGMAYVGTGQNFVSVPGITIGNLTGVSLKLIEAPQAGCSPNTASTSQVQLKVTVNVPLVANVTLTYTIASANAAFAGAVCASPTNTASVAVGTSLLSTHAKVTTLLNVVLLDTDLAASTEGGGSALTYNVSRTVSNPTGSIPPDPTQTKSTGTGSLGIESSTSTGLSGLVSVLINTTTSTVLNSLTGPLLGPLEKMAGISIGGADVTLNQFTCTASQLLH